MELYVMMACAFVVASIIWLCIPASVWKEWSRQ